MRVSSSSEYHKDDLPPRIRLVKKYLTQKIGVKVTAGKIKDVYIGMF